MAEDGITLYRGFKSKPFVGYGAVRRELGMDVKKLCDIPDGRLYDLLDCHQAGRGIFTSFTTEERIAGRFGNRLLELRVDEKYVCNSLDELVDKISKGKLNPLFLDLENSEREVVYLESVPPWKVEGVVLELQRL